MNTLDIYYIFIHTVVAFFLFNSLEKVSLIMFEGFTLEAQREIEAARGWKPGYSALTYCTAEAVVMRQRSMDPCDLLSTEVLVAKRISGAPDCLGKLQSKWGGYTKPSDPSPIHAMQRTLQETLGWSALEIDLQFAGIIGPWLYQSTVEMTDSELILNVSEIQAEQTPFQATLFVAIVSDQCELGQGGYLKSTEGARWITLGDLIAEEGQNPHHLYWEMTFDCLQAFQNPTPQILFRGPGRYVLEIHR